VDLLAKKPAAVIDPHDAESSGGLCGRRPAQTGKRVAWITFFSIRQVEDGRIRIAGSRIAKACFACWGFSPSREPRGSRERPRRKATPSGESGDPYVVNETAPLLDAHVVFEVATDCARNPTGPRMPKARPATRKNGASRRAGWKARKRACVSLQKPRDHAHPLLGFLLPAMTTSQVAENFQEGLRCLR
jgi:hypothetical protein